MPPGTAGGGGLQEQTAGLWDPRLPRGSLHARPLTECPLPLRDLTGEAETTEEVMNFQNNDNVFGIVPGIQ